MKESTKPNLPAELAVVATRSKNDRVPLLWRIVFSQQMFVIQIANNFGGPRLSWITVTVPGETIEHRIPEDYLSVLKNQLGATSMLIRREVVEYRAVPVVFSSYGEARRHAIEVMDLPVQQEWKPGIAYRELPWWRRLFSRFS